MAKNPYLLTATERDYIMDLFAQGKPLRTVKRYLAKNRGVSKITSEIDYQIGQALRSVNPNSHMCSDKARREIIERKSKFARERKRAVFNTSGTLLQAIENHLEKAAFEIVETALENADNPARLKALLQAIDLIAEMGNDWMTADDKARPGNARDNQKDRTRTQAALETLERVLRGGDGSDQNV